MVILLLFVFLITSCVPYQLDKCFISDTVNNPKELKKEAELYSKRGFGEGYYCMGILAFENSNYNKAIEFFKKAYLKGVTKASFYLGKSYLKLGQVDLASKWFFIALKKDINLKAYFDYTPYISKKELSELETLAREKPIIYLYLGDYFFKNEVYSASLYYYGIATRYGFKKAIVGFALSLYRLGNFRGALDILYSYYEKTKDKKGAYLLGSLIEKFADSINFCTILNASSLKDFLTKKVKVLKEKSYLYREAAEFYELSENYGDYKRAIRKALFFSVRKKSKFKIKLGRGNSKKSKSLVELCKKGDIEAELKLARLRGEEWYEELLEFYRLIGFRFVR